MIFFIGLTLIFIDVTGSLHTYLSWMAELQFLPAILALNAGVIVFIVCLTVIFGRIYCSVICPLGVFQDVVSHISARRKKKKNRFFYSRAVTWLRFTILALFIIGLLAGVGSFVALLAPYSSYGRIASNLFAPVYAAVNNVLAYLSQRLDSYMFYSSDVYIKSLPTFIIAAVTFIIITILSWRNGRTYCNTICPVGTVLGYLSKLSIFRMEIDTDNCRDCHLCERRCKASAIDIATHTVDYSRCVDCMDCLDNCKFDSMHFVSRLNKKKSASYSSSPTQKDTAKAAGKNVDDSRRTFLLTTAAVVTGAATAEAKKKVDGGLAAIQDKVAPKRATKIVPPGAHSIDDFEQHCTGCQLCVQNCPNEVLRPSLNLNTLMQPEMSYERGYCRPECNNCAEVCPTGAIRHISLPEKVSTQIGTAIWLRRNCVVITDDVECGNCARHCPNGAIQMVPINVNDANSHKIPVVNAERCIGCGACENLCPARPYSAIYVEGHEAHKLN